MEEWTEGDLLRLQLSVNEAEINALRALHSKERIRWVVSFGICIFLIASLYLLIRLFVTEPPYSDINKELVLPLCVFLVFFLILAARTFILSFSQLPNIARAIEAQMHAIENTKRYFGWSSQFRDADRPAASKERTSPNE